MYNTTLFFYDFFCNLYAKTLLFLSGDFLFPFSVVYIIYYYFGWPGQSCKWRTGQTGRYNVEGGKKMMILASKESE